MGVLFSLAICIVMWVVWNKMRKNNVVTRQSIIIKRITLIAAVFFSYMVVSNCIVVIDAGEVGVQVFFGKVQERTLKAGINFVNPFVNIVKYPTRIQEYTMTIAPKQGEPQGDDSITARTLDGLEVVIDLTVWWLVNPEKVNEVYERVAKNMYYLEYNITRPAIRTVIRDVAARYKMDDMYTEKRKDFTQTITDELRVMLKDKHIVIDNTLVRNIKLPKTVDDAIQNKMKAKQEQETMEYKKNIAKKEAEIREIEAQGLARAQAIINSTLTPLYLQHEAIQGYTKLAGSQNTTFVILPTSPNSAGMPLIIGGVK